MADPARSPSRPRGTIEPSTVDLAHRVVGEPKLSGRLLRSPWADIPFAASSKGEALFVGAIALDEQRHPWSFFDLKGILYFKQERPSNL